MSFPLWLWGLQLLPSPAETLVSVIGLPSKTAVAEGALWLIKFLKRKI